MAGRRGARRYSRLQRLILMRSYKVLSCFFVLMVDRLGVRFLGVKIGSQHQGY